MNLGMLGRTVVGLAILGLITSIATPATAVSSPDYPMETRTHFAEDDTIIVRNETISLENTTERTTNTRTNGSLDSGTTEITNTTTPKTGDATNDSVAGTTSSSSDDTGGNGTATTADPTEATTGVANTTGAAENATTKVTDTTPDTLQNSTTKLATTTTKTVNETLNQTTKTTDTKINDSLLWDTASLNTDHTEENYSSGNTFEATNELAKAPTRYQKQTVPTWQNQGPSSSNGGPPPTPGIAVVSLGALFVGAFGRWSLPMTDTLLSITPRLGTVLSLRPAFESRGWWSRLRRIFIPFGYSRYDDSDPLTHTERTALYERICRSPGVNLSSLAEAEDMPLSTVRHHLRVLTWEGLVEDRKIRGKRRYFPVGVEDTEATAALEDEAMGRVLESLIHRGSSNVSSLADDLDRDPSTITHHLQCLEEAGLVKRHRDGRSVTNTPTARARAMLQTHASSTSVANWDARSD